MQHTTCPNQPISLRAVDERRCAICNRSIVVPRHINRIRNRRVDLTNMNQRVSMLRINCADLIRVRASIPNPVQQLIYIFISTTFPQFPIQGQEKLYRHTITMKPPRIASQRIIRPVRHSRIMHLQPRHLHTPRRIMHKRQIPKRAPLLLSRRRIPSRPRDMEPQRLIFPGVCRCITRRIADPERRLRERDANVLRGI